MALGDNLHAAVGEVLGVTLQLQITGISLDVQAVADPLHVADLLERQITGSVRWVETVQTLGELGVDVFIEFGPGTVLTGLVKRILPGARTINVGSAEAVADFAL